MSVSAIPAGYHSVTPYLAIKGASEAIAFYQKAFGAQEVMRLPLPGGLVAHAEIKIGDSHIMLADEFPDHGNKSPTTLQGSSCGLCIYVEDADDMFARAVAAGATVMRPMQDQFYGDRSGTVVDPYGHIWTLATHIEDVTPAEMERRMASLMGG